MAGAAHPWRDILSNNAIEKLSKVLGKNLPGLWKNIETAVRDYHATDKTIIDLIPTRITQLKNISQLCDPNADKINTNDTPKLVPDAQDGQHFNQDADRWLGSIARRCQKKADYLEIMKDWHSRQGNSLHTSTPTRFFDYLNRMGSANKSSRWLTLGVANRMERLDPYHRGAELHVGSGGISPIDGNPMSEALCIWLAAGEGTQIPFFLWLENQPVCLTTPGLDDEYQEAYKTRVRKVDYDLQISAVKFEGNIAMWKNIEADGDWIVLDTSQFMGKMVAELAYVWTRDDEIFTAPHKPQRLHHSSFTQGKRVKCAGMWQVINGSVLYIDDNSGHYRPQPLHMKNLAIFLNGKNVFHENARVKTHTLKSDSVGDFISRDLSVYVPRWQELKIGAAAAPKATKTVPDEMLKPAATQQCTCGKSTWFGEIDPNKKCFKCGATDPR